MLVSDNVVFGQSSAFAIGISAQFPAVVQDNVVHHNATGIQHSGQTLNNRVYANATGIFANASTAGMKHFFVEQDGAPKPFENIATSLANLNNAVA